MTTIETYLHSATQKLVQAGIGTARLDVLVLLEDILDTNRAQLLAHPELELTAAEVQKLDDLIARRATHEPLAYLRGKVEFYGREFIVTRDVLVPRPESETMIDLLKALLGHSKLDLGSSSKSAPLAQQTWLNSSLRRNDCLKNEAENGADFDKSLENNKISKKNNLTSKAFSSLTIADVGTGSGALGITAALELAGSHVELLEIDPAALRVASQNVDKYGLQSPLTRSDLLAEAHLPVDVLLCNLPYVPDAHTINQAAMSEPTLAIFGGEDGLDLFRRLFQQIDALDSKPKLILTESLPPQHTELAMIAAKSGYQQAAEDDFIQAFTLA